MPINFSSKKTFIKKIIIKENQSHYFFIGTYNIKKSISYLKIQKLKFNKDNYNEYYSYKLKDIINEIDIENTDSSNEYFEEKLDSKDVPIKQIKEINALFGFIKFNMGYYAIFSCDSEIVGKIGRNIIYRVDRLFYFPLFEIEDDFKQSNEYMIEGKYFTLVTSFVYDKQLYFSYSYDLTKSLQRNFVENFKREMIPNYENNSYTKSNEPENFLLSNLKNIYRGYYKKDKNNDFSENKKLSMKRYTNQYFCWNFFHMKEFFNLIKNKSWINYYIYGYFGQSICNIKGLRLIISVIARRNRNYAGVRFLKRGISEDGNVANDVETEQILEEISTTWMDHPKISSYIQIRGSIPVNWYQNQKALLEKPNININLSDIRFEATKRHFASLLERYGHPCIVCNLTKKNEEGRKQETLLNEWYYHSINYINKNISDGLEKISYYHYDLKVERVKKNFYRQLYDISGPFIAKTNLFSFMPKLKNKFEISLQNGVVRTNCIDCLDRTNVFQQILGIAVIVIQLNKIGVNEKFPENENENIYGVLTELYRKMGHELSSQYSGSLALKQTITDNRNIMKKIFDSGYEILIAVKRSLNNYFNDQNKQNAMNLFLGKYPINTGLPYLWDMPNDEILHKKKNLKQLSKCWYEENFNKYIIFNLFLDIDRKKILQNNGKIIYIEKNEQTFLSSNHSGYKKECIKMSTTSLLIYNDLCLKNNVLGNRECCPLIKRENKKLTHYSFTSNNNIINTINEYILDYSQYLEFKSKNESQNDEEKAFEDDSIMTFLPKIKNQDMRDFNNIEFYPVNFIKKNIINNNNSNIEKVNNNYSITNFNINSGKQYFEDFHHLKTNFSLRKSVKFNTPIKNKISKSKFIKLNNEPLKYSKIRENFNSHFAQYTPMVPTYISNYNYRFSPNYRNKYCTNPRNVAELKKEMIKLDICSFQFEDKDFNQINDFTQPIEKIMKKKDFYELDPFNTCDLDNTEDIINKQKLNEEIQEFDPFENMLSKENKKEEIENEVDDYIIFDVKRNMLFKKCPDFKKKKTNLMPIKDFISNIGYGGKKEDIKNDHNNIDEGKKNVEKETTNKGDEINLKISSEDNYTAKEDNQPNSPKIKIGRIKRIPLKIEEDYFIIK